MGTIDTTALHQEMVELEYEVENSQRPCMSPESIEDVDDKYQENLEYNWWLDEQQDRYDVLRKSLGLPQKRL